MHRFHFRATRSLRFFGSSFSIRPVLTCSRSPGVTCCDGYLLSAKVQSAGPSMAHSWRRSRRFQPRRRAIPQS